MYERMAAAMQWRTHFNLLKTPDGIATFRSRKILVGHDSQKAEVKRMRVRAVAYGTASVARNRLSGVRVLVVDDDEDIGDVLQMTLTQSGAQARVATSAARARAELLTFMPHVLLTDISMPGENGIEFLASVRAIARLRSVPAIAMTALRVTTTLRSRLHDAGFSTLLAKPFGAEQLEETIATLADHDV
jgi:CheY-like chemotaxis protein